MLQFPNEQQNHLQIMNKFFNYSVITANSYNFPINLKFTFCFFFKKCAYSIA